MPVFKVEFEQERPDTDAPEAEVTPETLKSLLRGFAVGFVLMLVCVVVTALWAKEAV